MAIEVSERFFPSTSKAGVNIRYLVWKDTANKKPVGVIQLTHGWGEHIERYDEMASRTRTHGNSTLCRPLSGGCGKSND